MDNASNFLIIADGEAVPQASAQAETAQAITEANGAPAGAEQPQQPQQQGGNPFGSMLILIPLFGLMYFLMIRPQRKRQKEMQAMQDTLKVGDKVMTVNGSIGVISRVGERTVWVSYGKMDVEYVRNAIAEVIKDKPAEAGDAASSANSEASK